MKITYLKRYHGIYHYQKNSQTRYGFRLHYYDRHHNRHEKTRRGFHSLRQAVNTKHRLSQQTENPQSDMTVGLWCHRYLNMIKPPVRKISTYKSYQHLLSENVIPLIGKYRLNELRLDVYQCDCLNVLLRKGLSHRTIVATDARLQTVINYAVKDGYLKSNPIHSADIPRVNLKPRKAIMNDSQLSRFTKTLYHHSLLIQAIYFTLLGTGMRCGELLGLKWHDVDLAHRIIHIRHTRDEYGLRDPKTSHSRRSFIISQSLDRLLAKYKQYCSSHYHVSQSSLIIRGQRGKPLMPNLVSVWLKRLLRESNNEDLIGRFTPHSIRHLFASRLISHGVNPIAVSHILGHANPDITMKIYAQSAPGQIPDIGKLQKKL